MGVAVKVTAIHHRPPLILPQPRTAVLVNVRRKIIIKTSIDGVNFTKRSFTSSDSALCRSTASSEIIDDELLSIAPLEVNQINELCSKWEWRGYTVNYLKYEGQNGLKLNPPLLLVHGFGASVAHWRRYF